MEWACQMNPIFSPIARNQRKARQFRFEYCRFPYQFGARGAIFSSTLTLPSPAAGRRWNRSKTLCPAQKSRVIRWRQMTNLKLGRIRLQPARQLGSAALRGASVYCWRCISFNRSDTITTPGFFAPGTIESLRDASKSSMMGRPVINLAVAAPFCFPDSR